MKYEKIYNKIINNRIKNKYDGYTESHHILPRSLGGSDDKMNLVDLSAREHYICHLLLTKMFDKDTPEYFKMLKAYNMMCNAKSNQKRDYKINSRLYESLRKDLSKAMSISQTGENNNQFGTMWIYNSIIKESKKVSKNYILENGWVKGRVTDWDNHFTQKNCIVCNKKGLQSKLSKTCSKVCTNELTNKVRNEKGCDKYTLEYKGVKLQFHRNFEVTIEEIEKFIECYKITKSIPKSIEYMGKLVTKYRYEFAYYIIERFNLSGK